jgi:hypothetical protein
MRRFPISLCIVFIASIASAQTQPSSAPPANPAQPAPQATAPAAKGPAVDGATVTGSTFHSDFFKLTYEFPKDWKAMDDEERMAANQRARDAESERNPVVVPKKNIPSKGPSQKKTSAAMIPPISLETYSLMVASPNGVSSLASEVLPRINIWAHKRYPSLNTIEDHAQFLVTTRHIQVVVAPQKTTINGHDFVRADVVMPGGQFRSQFVTQVNDFLVGFEFHATNAQEAETMIETMRSVKFQ